jgi:hypothetical protein
MILVCKEKAEQFPKVDPRLASYFTIFEMENSEQVTEKWIRSEILNSLKFEILFWNEI